MSEKVYLLIDPNVRVLANRTISEWESEAPIPCAEGDEVVAYEEESGLQWPARVHKVYGTGYGTFIYLTVRWAEGTDGTFAVQEPEELPPRS